MVSAPGGGGVAAAWAGEGDGAVEACRIDAIVGMANGVYLCHCAVRNAVPAVLVRRWVARGVFRDADESCQGGISKPSGGSQ